MDEQKKKKSLSQEDIMNLLDLCYEKCLHGVQKVSPSVESMANDYLAKYPTKDEACKAMLRNQIAKCTTSGFVTGFGGIVTMPVMLPANVGSLLYQIASQWLAYVILLCYTISNVVLSKNFLSIQRIVSRNIAIT